MNEPTPPGRRPYWGNQPPRTRRLEKWDVNGGPGPKLTVSGQTEDGRPVVSFFYLVEIYGVSIDTVLESFMQAGFVPDWESFIKDSLKKRWQIKSTKIKIETAILYVYGPEYLKEWRRRWDKMFGE